LGYLKNTIFTLIINLIIKTKKNMKKIIFAIVTLVTISACSNNTSTLTSTSDSTSVDSILVDSLEVSSVDTVVAQ
jgi:uncharacterized lipoprotein YajG